MTVTIFDVKKWYEDPSWTESSKKWREWRKSDPRGPKPNLRVSDNSVEWIYNYKKQQWEKMTNKSDPFDVFFANKYF